MKILNFQIPLDYDCFLHTVGISGALEKLLRVFKLSEGVFCCLSSSLSLHFFQYNDKSLPLTCPFYGDKGRSEMHVFSISYLEIMDKIYKIEMNKAAYNQYFIARENHQKFIFIYLGENKILLRPFEGLYPVIFDFQDENFEPIACTKLMGCIPYECNLTPKPEYFKYSSSSLIYTDDNGSIFLYNWKLNKCKLILKEHYQKIHQIATLPNGYFLILGKVEKHFELVAVDPYKCKIKQELYLPEARPLDIRAHPARNEVLVYYVEWIEGADAHVIIEIWDYKDDSWVKKRKSCFNYIDKKYSFSAEYFSEDMICTKHGTDITLYEILDDSIKYLATISLNTLSTELEKRNIFGFDISYFLLKEYLGNGDFLIYCEASNSDHGSVLCIVDIAYMTLAKSATEIVFDKHKLDPNIHKGDKKPLFYGYRLLEAVRSSPTIVKALTCWQPWKLYYVDQYFGLRFVDLDSQETLYFDLTSFSDNEITSITKISALSEDILLLDYKIRIPESNISRPAFAIFDLRRAEFTKKFETAHEKLVCYTVNRGRVYLVLRVSNRLQFVQMVWDERLVTRTLIESLEEIPQVNNFEIFEDDLDSFLDSDSDETRELRAQNTYKEPNLIWKLDENHFVVAYGDSNLTIRVLNVQQKLFILEKTLKEYFNQLYGYNFYTEKLVVTGLMIINPSLFALAIAKVDRKEHQLPTDFGMVIYFDWKKKMCVKINDSIFYKTPYPFGDYYLIQSTNLYGKDFTGVLKYDDLLKRFEKDQKERLDRMPPCRMNSISFWENYRPSFQNNQIAQLREDMIVLFDNRNYPDCICFLRRRNLRTELLKILHKKLGAYYHGYVIRDIMDCISPCKWPNSWL